MCQEFVESEADMSLMHPFRQQEDASRRRVIIFEYYGVPRVFNVRTLPNLHVIIFQRYLPEKIFKIPFFLHGLL
jgi:hypothetical protein